VTLPALKRLGFSGRPRAISMVFTCATWLEARILEGMNPDNSIWYAATWNKDVMTTDSQNIQTAYDIARRCGATLEVLFTRDLDSSDTGRDTSATWHGRGLKNQAVVLAW
jgi:hypothetical protein